MVLNKCLWFMPLPFPTILARIGPNDTIFLENLDKEKDLQPVDGSERMRTKEEVLHQHVLVLLV